MKPEARLLLVATCDGYYVGVVFRGPHRVEHVYVDRTIRGLAERVAAKSVAEQLRYAYPAEAGRLLGLEPLSSDGVNRYLSVCSAWINRFIDDLCRAAGLLVGAIKV